MHVTLISCRTLALFTLFALLACNGTLLSPDVDRTDSAMDDVVESVLAPSDTRVPMNRGMPRAGPGSFVDSDAEVPAEALHDEEWIVRFRPSVSRENRAAILGAQASSIRHFADDNLLHRHVAAKAPQRLQSLFDELVVARINPESRNGELERLRNHPSVSYVAPNLNVQLSLTPNDPLLPELWGLHNTGQTFGMVDADMDAPEAWDITTGSSQIVVAVIDTGIDYTHPDLAANMWTNPEEIADNGIDDDGNGFVDDLFGYDFSNQDGDPIDDHFHGTHVAGTIGAAGDNGTGCVGVNWTVRLMAVKFLSASGGGSTADAISAIQYAINNGAHVLNNSWGGKYHSQALQDAITAANDAGVTVVAAAGNTGDDRVHYPSAYEGVISVSASTHDNTLAYFSTYGEAVDVAAPGLNIHSTFPTYTTAAMGSNRSPNYETISGTSMACPHVAGLAALALSRDPSLTPAQIEALLEVHSDDLGDPGPDLLFGAGRVNAHRVVQAVESGNTDFPNLKIASPVNGEVIEQQLTIMGTADGNTFESYQLWYGQGAEWVQIASSTAPVTNGALGTLDTGSLNDGPITVRLAVTDTSGNLLYYVVRPQIDNIVAELSVAPLVGADSAGSVDFMGSASVAVGTLDNYKLEYSAGFNSSNWTSSGITLQNAGREPVSDALLGTLNLSGLTSDFYQIRLVVHSSTGAQEVREAVSYIDEFLRPGWPLVTPGLPRSSAVVGDVDGVGSAEILTPGLGTHIASSSGELLYSHPNSDLTPWTKIIGTPALGNLDSTLPGDELAYFLHQKKQLWASNLQNPIPGFPVDVDGGHKLESAGHTTMLADVDNDGSLDMIWAGPDYEGVDVPVTHVSLFAVDSAGIPLPGFPFVTPYADAMVLRAGAVADLDGDGQLEIFFSVLQFPGKDSHWNPLYYKASLYGVASDGTLLPGFPLHHEQASDPYNTALSNLVIADINLDGQKEVVFIETATTEDRSVQRFAVHAVDKSGAEVFGWPYAIDGGNMSDLPWDGGMLAIANVRGDAHPEILAAPNMTSEGGVSTFMGVVRVLDYQAKLLATVGNGSPGIFSAASGFSAADLNGDGYADLLLVLTGRYGDNSNSIRVASILVYDLSNTNSNRYDKCSSGCFLSLTAPNFRTSDGDLYGLYRMRRSIPGVFDIDGDGQLEVVANFWAASNGWNSGATFVWSLPFAPAENFENWAQPQGNAARTGEYLPRNGASPTGDTTAPTVQILSPAEGATISSIVEITASASDNVGIDHVDFWAAGRYIATSTGGQHIVSWDSDLVADGIYEIRAIAIDAAGNQSASVVSVTTSNPDLTPPSVQIVTPSDGRTVYGVVNVRANAYDNRGVQRIDFHIDGELAASVEEPLYQFSWDTSTSTPGSHALRATAFDLVGNQSSTTISVTVLAPDSEGPSVKFLSPADGAIISGGKESIQIATQDPSGVRQLRLYIDGVPVASWSDPKGSVSWGWALRKATSGTHLLRAEATDNQRNVRVTTVSVTVQKRLRRK